MIRVAFPLVLLSLAGCSEKISRLSCETIVQRVIGQSGGKLVDIKQMTQTSRDDNNLVCHGTGVTNHGHNIPTRFQAMTGQSAKIIFTYDQDEYRAEMDRKVEQEQRLDEARFRASYQ